MVFGFVSIIGQPILGNWSTN